MTTDEGTPTTASGELYAGLEHFASDGADGGQHDMTGEMEDIFLVVSHIILSV